MGIDEISERLGTLTASIDALGKRVEGHLTSDIEWHTKVEGKFNALYEVLNQAKGAQRLAVWLIAIAIPSIAIIVALKLP